MTPLEELNRHIDQLDDREAKSELRYLARVLVDQCGNETVGEVLIRMKDTHRQQQQKEWAIG